MCLSWSVHAQMTLDRQPKHTSGVQGRWLLCIMLVAQRNKVTITYISTTKYSYEKGQNKVPTDRNAKLRKRSCVYEALK